jgi:SAM-dependent methyltransferase
MVINKLFKKYYFTLLFILFFQLAHSQNYDYKKPNRDGTGKIYLGREISTIMGHLGAPWLERTTRSSEERTDLVVKSVGLKTNDIIADFGAGSGYYTKRLAPLCSLVYAVDIQKEMLKINKNNMMANKVDNVEFILGSDKATNLPDQSVDYLIMVDVYHELEFPYEVMQDIHRAMKVNGQVILVEYKKEDPKIMIKPLHKMSVKQVQKEMNYTGFVFNRSFDELPLQHMLFFTKKIK